MGIKFTREYNSIIDELTDSIMIIDNFYEFFDMSSEDWKSMDQSEKAECARTLADDIFYGLGSENEIEVGDGRIKYIEDKNTILVSNKESGIAILLF